ncbi:MAG: hypothetical protein ACPL6C_04275 [bacterium]
MQTDYIPRTDAGFDIFQANFIALVQPKLATWGIPATEFDALTALQTEWNSAWERAKNKDTRSRADVQAKREARKAYQSALRKFVRQWIAFNSKVSDADREALGLKVKDVEPTPMPVPDRAPDITVVEIKHLSHKLRLTDPANPHTQSKPKGVRAIQVFRYIGESAPEDISKYQYVGDATRFLFESKFTLKDVCNNAYYIARYVNTRGIPGPWSNVVSAAIA